MEPLTRGIFQQIMKTDEKTINEICETIKELSIKLEDAK